jgi:hypothetical protein
MTPENSVFVRELVWTLLKSRYLPLLQGHRHERRVFRLWTSRTQAQGPDYIKPSEPDEKQKPIDPIPDMNPDGQDPDENEVVN